MNGNGSTGTWVAVVVVVVIILLLLAFFFLCGGSGCGSDLLKCFKACRICATAKSNQISLGPCCEATITNSVAQKTTYTLPDPGEGGAATFVLSKDGALIPPSAGGVVDLPAGSTAGGNPIVTSSGGTGTAVGGAVTLNGTSGVIEVPVALLAGGGVGSNIDVTVTNSSAKAASVLLLTIEKLDFTPAVTQVLNLTGLTLADGSFSFRVQNIGTVALPAAPANAFVAFLLA